MNAAISFSFAAHRRVQVSRVELGDHGFSITVVSIGVPAGGQEMAPGQQFGLL
jgi:hypothetical protein